MIRAFLFSLYLLLAFNVTAQTTIDYHSLDPKQPIHFLGDRIIYHQDTISLGPKAFFIDGGLPDSVVAKYRYVYTTVNKAAAQLTPGTEAEPMTLYIAPWVYWIDDPDDPAIRVPKEGTTPYGLVIACEWLKFQGLTDNPENVVLASNRGQTIGAQGNFTMFRFIGQGTSSENLTFGNYCNVDLVFPLKPQLGRPKRASAIVQAQLIHCNGDKIVARNTHFISRLNLCPFVGGKRVLFDRCHFESTDDALCGTGVYLNSTLDFYASKPFYNTNGTGAVFLNCAIHSFVGDKQYFTKAKGQVVVIDSRLTAPANSYWGWQEVVPSETRNYQANVLLNGKPLFIGKSNPASTIDISDKPLLDAYRFVYQGKVVYNTYNLLRGNDDWDPMGNKPLLLEAERQTQKTLSLIPVQLSLSPTGVSVETKKNQVQLKAVVMRFGNYAAEIEKLTWAVDRKDQPFVQLKVSEDGSTCTVVPTNQQDETRQVVVQAFTPSGLEGASVIWVSPTILEAPAFRVRPKILPPQNGNLRVQYVLNSKYTDQSDVRWYRCSDAAGNNPIEVAVSRSGVPLQEYSLSLGDVGYYLMVSVSAKHIRSRMGEATRFVFKNPITAADVKTSSKVLITNFINNSTRNQPLVLPGFWTLDYLEPNQMDARNTLDKNKDAWYYGEGSEGAAGHSGLLQGRNASLYYTPVGEQFGDMKLTLSVAPFKTAGQGFSVAHLYMDVLIKFNAKTKSGYALRFIRTTKHHDAVDCLLIKYQYGEAIPISEPVSTSAFRTLCTINLEIRGDKLLAHVTTTASGEMEDRSDVFKAVSLEGTIDRNDFGGFGIEYNGGSPTLIKSLKVEWK